LYGPQRKVLRTARQTVGAALEEAGISLDSADGVVPDQQDGLVHNMRITVFRSFPLTIQDNGNTIQVQSRHTSAADVLAEAGIKLVGQDYTLPGNDALLRPNDVISVVRVTEDFLLEDEPIAYQTLWQATPELPIDSQAIVSPGVAGISRRRFRVRYENGVKVSQIVDGEWIAREPVNEVIGYGTRIDLNVVDTPEGPREFWRVVRMRVTSYTAASSGKTPDDPDYGLTASGLQAGYGVVAIDRNIVPFRSYVYVPGYGIGYAGDTGGGIRGRWIDLGYDEDSFVSWSGYVDVYYLTPVPPPQDINYLLPVVLP
jgi:3D (Asp-Asp-Asp) domain-containing protein